MIPTKRVVLSGVVLGLMSIAAGRQVAMRVEVTPIRADGDGTLAEIVIRVAPEDRGALGEDVMVWAELSRDKDRVSRKGWAVKIDDPTAGIRVEAVWPPGDYEVRVDVDGGSGRSFGVWWGDVTIPDFMTPVPVPAAPEPAAQETAEAPPSVPIPPEPAAVAGAAAQTSQEPPAPLDDPTREIDDPARWDEVGGIEDAAGKADSSVPVVAAATAPEAAAAAVAIGGTSATPPPEQPTSMTRAPEGAAPGIRPPGEREAASPPALPTPTVAATSPAAEAVVAAETTPSPPVAAVAAPSPTTAPPPPMPTTPQPAIGLAGQFAAWGRSGTDHGELTITATRAGVAATGLTANDVVVRSGKTEVNIVELGGPGEAPLLLGVAVDLHGGPSGGRAEIGRMVSRLTDRAAGGRGLVFVNTADGAGTGWGLDPGSVWERVAAPGSSAGGDLPALIAGSLDAFRGRRGRAFLLVVTDGRGARERGGWKEAFLAAETAGVPVLVAGIWTAEFSQGTRKDLGRVAELSGGGVFFVQGPGQVSGLADRFGSLLDGSYAAKVDAPPETTRLKVTAVAGDVGIRGSTAVRRGEGIREPAVDAPMRGLFTYLADAATFLDCQSGRRFPVAMEADYLDAERAYLEARSEPGAPLLMTVEARIEPRPGMEGDGSVSTVVIDRFVAVHPGEDCGGS